MRPLLASCRRPTTARAWSSAPSGVQTPPATSGATAPSSTPAGGRATAGTAGPASSSPCGCRAGSSSTSRPSTAASTNGGLDVRGATAEVVARTVNGSVRAETGGGPVSAKTINGSVWARMLSTGDARDLECTSVNGSVTVEFPVTLTGRIDPRRLRATIGDGSRHLRLRTVNGNVDLRRAG